jgi:hypothetical protein
MTGSLQYLNMRKSYKQKWLSWTVLRRDRCPSLLIAAGRLWRGRGESETRKTIMLPHTSRPTPFYLIMVNIVFYFTHCITDVPSKSSHYNHSAEKEKEKTEGDGHSVDVDGNLGNTTNYFITANKYDISNMYSGSHCIVLLCIHSLF